MSAATPRTIRQWEDPGLSCVECPNERSRRELFAISRGVAPGLRIRDETAIRREVVRSFGLLILQLPTSTKPRVAASHFLKRALLTNLLPNVTVKLWPPSRARPKASVRSAPVILTCNG